MAGRILTILILVLAGLLAAVWLVPFAGWTPPSPIRPEIARLSGGQGPAASSPLENVLARPVFWPSRRLAEAPAEQPAPGLADNARLLGLLGRGTDAVAIVYFEDKTWRLTPGSMLAGWRFERVEGDSAVFSRPGEVQRIALPKKLAQELPRQSSAERTQASPAAPRQQKNVTEPSPRAPARPARPDRRR